MEVFISWSGERSKIFAELLHDFIQRLLHPIKPWMSSIDIEKGVQWNMEIASKLSKDSVGIICTTPENQTSAWLMFEAGAISKTIDVSRVMPILIGLEPEELVSPLNQFQATTLVKEDFFKLIESLNKQLKGNKRSDKILKEEFELRWGNFYSEIQTQINGIQFQTSSSVFPKILDALKKNGLPKPQVGTTVQFNEGFESHIIYDSVYKIADNRLYIFGRKNRKVFDKEHWWFFEKLNQKIAKGFDFRCLFLDTAASEFVISNAHEDYDFKEQLKLCVDNAVRVFNKYNIDPANHIRTYKLVRPYSIVIADEAVLFKPIEVNEVGKAKKLTRSSFTLTSSMTSQGKSIEEYFLSVWNHGSPI
ncbi:MAG: toll/interleukin-1 receptor domain-containing protein [Bacteroidota bacterium]|nr:toll/interleukin-1 receptor domain-containing protein [Bacteroidota bacterium]